MPTHPAPHHPGLGSRAILIVLLGLLTARQAHAQSVSRNLWIPDGPVNAIASLGDTAYIGGSFTRVHPVTGGGMPVDLTTGLAVAGLPRIHGQVLAVISDGAGGWFVGGTFDSVGSQPRSNVARILSDLSVSPWNPIVDDAVNSLTISSGIVYLGGSFQNVNSTYRPWLAAVNATTGALTTWDSHCDGPVYALGVSGTRLYAGGLFFDIGLQPRTYLASLELSTALASSWDPEPDGFVWAIAFGSGVVYVGGDFSHVSLALTPRNGAAAYSTSTGALATWDANVQGTVYALAVTGTTVYLGGSFSMVHSTSRNNLAAMNTSGTLASWNPNLGGVVAALALNGTNVLVGGDFATAGAQSRLRLASIDASGTVLAWDPAADANVVCLAISGTRVYAGGMFNAGGGVPRRNLAALNLNTGLATVWKPDPDQPVDALVVGSDNTGTSVFAGGRFTSIGGAARPKVARIDLGAGAAISAWNAQCDGDVTTLTLTNGVLYAGGAFSHIGGASRPFLGAVRTATALATAWNPSCNGLPYAIVPAAGGVFVGGAFTTPHLRVAKYDTLGAVMGWSADADNVVYSLGVLWDTVYLGGDFRHVAGQTRSRLAAVNTKTGAINAWNPVADSTVRAMLIDANFVVISGSFVSVAGQTRSHAAAVRGTHGPGPGGLLDWNPGVAGDVKALLLRNVQTAIGGAFQSVGGISQASFALVGPTTGTTVDVPTVQIDSGMALGRVAPNPMRTTARVSFTLARPALVSLALFDVSGRRAVQILDRAPFVAGPHEATVSSAGLEPGVYFLQLETGRETANRKLTMVR